MPGYRFSNDATHDIEALTVFSLKSFGPERTGRYLNDLENCLELIADNPRMGRDLSSVRGTLRRHEHQSHVIYYRQDGDAILILRILGRGQDPALHL